MSRFGKFTISGVEYDLDDLTLNEIEEIEDNCGGVPFSEINYGSAKGMKAIAFTLMKRSNSGLTMEEIGQVKLLDFVEPEEEFSPPDEAGEEMETNGSAPEATGVPPSLVSIPG